MLKVTAFTGIVEMTEYTETGEVHDRPGKRIFAFEAEIPIEFRQWLLERAPVPQQKEG